jgi:hypothetical protein
MYVEMGFQLNLYQQGHGIAAAEVQRQDKGEIPPDLINPTQQAGECQQQAAGHCGETQVYRERLPLGHSGGGHCQGSRAVAMLMSKHILQG